MFGWDVILPYNCRKSFPYEDNKRTLQSFASRMCIAMLAVLGFSCSDDEEENILCMYGTPTGTFEVKGQVTDAEGKLMHCNLRKK